VRSRQMSCRAEPCGLILSHRSKAGVLFIVMLMRVEITNFERELCLPTSPLESTLAKIAHKC
jgi:hypothetical protein